MLAKEGSDKLSKLAAAFWPAAYFFVTSQILSRLYFFSLMGVNVQESDYVLFPRVAGWWSVRIYRSLLQFDEIKHFSYRERSAYC